MNLKDEGFKILFINFAGIYNRNKFIKYGNRRSEKR